MGAPPIIWRSEIAASIAGCVWRQQGHGLIDVRCACQGAFGSRNTASGSASGQAAAKILRSFQDRGRSGEAPPREIGGKNARVGSAARVQVLRHRTGVEELPEAGGLRSRVAKRVHDLLLAQVHERRRRDGGAVGSAGRRVVPDAIVGRADRHADTARRFEPCKHRDQKRAAARAFAFGERPGSGDDDAARMHDGSAVKIVGFENVRQRAQHEGTVAGRARLRFLLPVENQPSGHGRLSGDGVGDGVERQKSAAVRSASVTSLAAMRATNRSVRVGSDIRELPDSGAG